MSSSGGGGGGGGEANKRRRVLLDSDDEEDMAPPPPPPPPPLSPLPGLDDRRHDDNSDLEEVVEEEGVEDERLTDDDEDGAGAGLSDEDGEDLMENMEADYVAIPELDTYDLGNLDQREYGAMDFDARRAAEMEIAERTEQRGRLDDILDRYGDEDEEARDRRRGVFDQRRAQEGMMGLEGGVEMEDEELNLEAYDVPLREWIAEDRTRREVKRRFRALLEGSKDGNGRLRYMDSIRNMCAANLTSLEVHYEVLRQEQATLALWLMDAPEDILEVRHPSLPPSLPLGVTILSASSSPSRWHPHVYFQTSFSDPPLPPSLPPSGLRRGR
jgi:DNA replication licensing factor MCM2